PAPAMTAHVVALLTDGGGDVCITLERQSAGEYCQRTAAFVKQLEQTPDAHATAVLEHRLGAEIAAADPARRPLGQACLARRIAVRNGLLGALLIVDDEV